MILDLNPLLGDVERLERRTGYQINEDELFATIFNNMGHEQQAMQKIEEQLLCVALDAVLTYDDIVMTTGMDIILREVRAIAARALRELQGLGMYQHHRLTFAYHSRPFRNAAYFIERKHHVRDYAY